MPRTGRWAVAKYAARGKGYLVVIRPLGKGLVMQQLYYPNEIRSMDEIDLGDADVKESELRMAIQLAEMSASDEFHPENYRDEVKERVRALIQRKIEGEEITSTMVDEPKAQVIDLMEALRASLGGSAAKPASKPASKAPGKIRELKAAPAKAAKQEREDESERKAPRRSARTVSANTVTAKRGR